MKIVPLEMALKSPKERGEILHCIRGGVMVYPTDTVYGIGCNAENPAVVSRLRKIKKAAHPLSVIAPSKRWIDEKCIITKSARAGLAKLPGKYTLILQKKDQSCLSLSSPGRTVGIRIPLHPFTRLIQKSGIPFVTTSANISGQSVAQTVSSLPFVHDVDITIDGGRLGKKASAIIDCTGSKPVFIKRK